MDLFETFQLSGRSLHTWRFSVAVKRRVRDLLLVLRIGGRTSIASESNLVVCFVGFLRMSVHVVDSSGGKADAIGTRVPSQSGRNRGSLVQKLPTFHDRVGNGSISKSSPGV